MSRRTAGTRRWASVLVTAALMTVGLPAGGPAWADEVPTGWPGGDWPMCATAQSLYCVQEATLAPVGGTATALATLGLWPEVSSYSPTLHWGVVGWNSNGTGTGPNVPAIHGGAIRLVLRIGSYGPHLFSSAAAAPDLRITQSASGGGNQILTVTGRATHTDWIDGDVDCWEYSGCGDEDTVGGQWEYRFSGDTNYMDPSDGEIFGGMYLASDAEARPRGPRFGVGEALFLQIPLANAHLSGYGQPVRGHLAAWLPPSYFTATGTTVAAAMTTGLDVLSSPPEDSESGTTVSLAASAVLRDGGVAVNVADLPYSAHNLDIHNRASTAVPGATVPAAPGNVGVAQNSTGLGVTWSPAAGNGRPVTGYTARAFLTATEGAVVGRCTATQAGCTIPGLTAGTTYHVAAYASNALGEGPSGARVGVNANPPSAPLAVVASPSDSALITRWQPPASSGGSTVTAYSAYLYAAATGGVAIDSCWSSAEDERVCHLSGGPLSNGRTYYVAVAATNGSGTGPQSTPRTAGTPRTSLTAPRTVAAVAGVGTLKVTWAVLQSILDQAGLPTALGGGYHLTGYTVRAYSAAAGGNPVRTCATTGVLTCTLRTLTAGARYYLTVAAASESGPGPQSGPRLVARPLPRANAPRSVTPSSSRGKVRIAWSTPTAVAGAVITGYAATLYTTAGGATVAARCAATAAGRACTTGALKVGRAYFASVATKSAAGTSVPAARKRVVVRR